MAYTIAYVLARCRIAIGSCVFILPRLLKALTCLDISHVQVFVCIWKRLRGALSNSTETAVEASTRLEISKYRLTGSSLAISPCDIDAYTGGAAGLAVVLQLPHPRRVWWGYDGQAGCCRSTCSSTPATTHPTKSCMSQASSIHVADDIRSIRGTIRSSTALPHPRAILHRNVGR